MSVRNGEEEGDLSSVEAAVVDEDKTSKPISSSSSSQNSDQQDNKPTHRPGTPEEVATESSNNRNLTTTTDEGDGGDNHKSASSPPPPVKSPEQGQSKPAQKLEEIPLDSDDDPKETNELDAESGGGVGNENKPDLTTDKDPEAPSHGSEIVQNDGNTERATTDEQLQVPTPIDSAGKEDVEPPVQPSLDPIAQPITEKPIEKGDEVQVQTDSAPLTVTFPETATVEKVVNPAPEPGSGATPPENKQSQPQPEPQPQQPSRGEPSTETNLPVVVDPPNPQCDIQPAEEKSPQPPSTSVSDAEKGPGETAAIHPIPELKSDGKQTNPESEPSHAVAPTEAKPETESAPEVQMTPAEKNADNEEMTVETRSEQSSGSRKVSEILDDKTLDDETKLSILCAQIVQYSTSSSGNQPDSQQAHSQLNSLSDALQRLFIYSTDEDLQRVRSPELLHCFFTKYLTLLPSNMVAEILSVLIAVFKKSLLNLDAARLLLLECLSFKTDDLLLEDLMREIVIGLVGYSCGVRELKALFGQQDSKLLRVLKDANTSQRNRPTSFFAFSGTGGSAIALPPLAKWPTQNGWSFVTWFRLEPASASAQPYLYYFRTSKSGVGYSAHFTGTCLVLTSMKIKGKGYQHCIQYEFQPSKWFHCAISYHTKWRSAEIRVYVNGTLIANTEMQWQVQTNDVFDRCFIGGTADLSDTHLFSGQLSSVYLFNEALGAPQICAIHRLGPSYSGAYKYSNEFGVELPMAIRKVLYEEKLSASLVSLYSPVAVEGERLCLQSAPKGNPSYFVSSPHAALLGSTRSIKTEPISCTLQSIGGLKVLLPLLNHFVQKNDSEACGTLIGFICDLLEQSPQWFANEVVQSHLFVIISSLLAKNSRALLTDNLLDIILNLTKTLLTGGGDSDSLLFKQLMDSILFNSHLWIYVDARLQLKLYTYLATEFLSGPPSGQAPVFSEIRRISTVLQLLHSLKYYYWIVEEPSIGVKARDTTLRPSQTQLIGIRSYILLFVKQLVLKGSGVHHDELQAILNYLSTVTEDENIIDVLQMLQSLMCDHPASVIPAFDAKHGVKTIFKLIDSSNEQIRIQALKLLGYFLSRSTQKRKIDVMGPFNLFMLLCERLLVYTPLTLQTYNALYEILTETAVDCSRSSAVCGALRIENPMILKVIATLIIEGKKTSPVKRLFISDLWRLLVNNRENRRLVLQMSVWQHWLVNLIEEDDEIVRDQILAVFRILLYHAIKYEYGGWRVWIDTLAIIHAKVSYDLFTQEYGTQDAPRDHHNNSNYHRVDRNGHVSAESSGTHDVRDTHERADVESPSPKVPNATKNTDGGDDHLQEETTPTKEADDGEDSNNKESEKDVDESQEDSRPEADRQPAGANGQGDENSADEEEEEEEGEETERNPEEGGEDEEEGAASKEQGAYTISSGTTTTDSKGEKPDESPGESDQADVAPTRNFRKYANSQKEFYNNLIGKSGATPAFRIPEFRWSPLHVKLLNDLLFSIECDLQMWRNHSMSELKSSLEQVLQMSDNQIYIVNAIHLVSQLSDNIIIAAGGLLPLLAAATGGMNAQVNSGGEGLSPTEANSLLYRLVNLVDVLCFAATHVSFAELEQEKNMSSGGILRQCLRLVATCAVKNSGEEVHISGMSISASGELFGEETQSDLVTNEEFNVSAPTRDVNKLLQDIDVNRLRACIYRDADADARQSQFLALASLYFISVLMVSKYRDIIEPGKTSEALTSKLEVTLSSVCPLLREIMCDFAQFLSKTLVGSHGQDLVSREAVRTFRRPDASPVELVMLLCSQEWQNTLQKNAGLAFIELINEGRLLSVAMKDHIVRVAMEAEFILNRLRADDVSKHETFNLNCGEALSARLHEENLINSLINSAKRRDWMIFMRFKEQLRPAVAYKQDTWEDDSRRKRRFVVDVWANDHLTKPSTDKADGGASSKSESQNDPKPLVVPKSQYSIVEDEEICDLWETEGDPGPDESGAVLYTVDCSLIWSIYSIEGSLQMTSNELYFEAHGLEKERKERDLNVLRYCDMVSFNGKLSLADIRAVFTRNYLLQQRALEVFVSQRTSVMFAFSDFETVKKVVRYLPAVGVGVKYGIQQSRRASLMTPRQLFASSNMTQKWQKREISNFEYLMFLNTIAGRTYQDLNQYPVFPWILTNYETEELDLDQPTNFRDLSKPIGALNSERRAEFIERFNNWDNNLIPPFHYGTHYSTAAFTLGWLVRLQPYYSAYLSIQDGMLDESRMFMSVCDSWTASLMGNQQNVKELTPEWFYLAEMFKGGNSLPDIQLPPWAQSPEHFVRLHRMALESDLVSCQLHQWIDLIFGYKQRGPEAVRAVNVFYYLTYDNNYDLSSVSDPAIESQIRHFGQTPCQLTTEPHPPRSSALHVSPLIYSTVVDEVCMSVKFPFSASVSFLAPCMGSIVTINSAEQCGIHKWTPKEQTHFTIDPIKRNQFDTTSFCHSLPSSHIVTVDAKFIIVAPFYDNSFRLFSSETGKLIQIIYGHRDLVSCLTRSECNTAADFYIASGSKDSSVLLWTWNAKYAMIEGNGTSSLSNPLPKLVLCGHESTITALSISAELGLIVSGSLNTILIHTTQGECITNIPVEGQINNLLIARELGFVVGSVSSNEEPHKTTPSTLFTYNLRGQPMRSASIAVQHMCVTRDGEYLVVSESSHSLKILRTFDLVPFYALNTQDLDESKIRSIALADQKYLLVGLDSGKLIIYNADFARWHQEFRF